MTVIDSCVWEGIELSVKCCRAQQIIAVTVIHFFDHICCTLFIYLSQVFYKPGFYQSLQIIPAVYHKHVRN